MEKNFKVLIVDDETDVVELLSDSLMYSLSGIDVDRAFDGLDAYALCFNNKYDLILTDHRMPRCTGLSFIEKLKLEKDSKNHKTPIIFVSAFIPEIKEDISSMDNLLYLDKPYSDERLIKYCKMLLHGGGNEAAK